MKYTEGVFNLIDLAGSERIKKSGASGDGKIEAGNINKSLLFLKDVITAIIDKHNFIPYNRSILTRYLRNSIGGNAKCIFMANISKSSQSTLTLKYASEVRRIKNTPVLNENDRERLANRLRMEIRITNEHIVKIMNLIDFLTNNSSKNESIEALINDLNDEDIKKIMRDETLDDHNKSIITKRILEMQNLKMVQNIELLQHLKNK